MTNNLPQVRECTFLHHYSQPHRAANLSSSSHSVWKFVFPRMNPPCPSPVQVNGPKDPDLRPRGGGVAGVHPSPHSGFPFRVESRHSWELGRRRIGPVTNQGEDGVQRDSENISHFSITNCSAPDRRLRRRPITLHPPSPSPVSTPSAHGSPHHPCLPLPGNKRVFH